MASRNTPNTKYGPVQPLPVVLERTAYARRRLPSSVRDGVHESHEEVASDGEVIFWAENGKGTHGENPTHVVLLHNREEILVKIGIRGWVEAAK